ncbi:MAG: hypothetical protein QXI19_02555 [Candidatus Caldarchaeum sp.]
MLWSIRLSGVGLVLYMGLLQLTVISTRHGAMILVGGLASLAALLNANIYFKPKGKEAASDDAG